MAAHHIAHSAFWFIPLAAHHIMWCAASVQCDSHCTLCFRIIPGAAHHIANSAFELSCCCASHCTLLFRIIPWLCFTLHTLLLNYPTGCTSHCTLHFRLIQWQRIRLHTPLRIIWMRPHDYQVFSLLSLFLPKTQELLKHFIIDNVWSCPRGFGSIVDPVQYPTGTCWWTRPA